MKCDVCYTNIPYGETRCPNCGMVVVKEPSTCMHQHYTTDEEYAKKKLFKKESKVSQNKPKKNIISIIIALIGPLIVTAVVFMGLYEDIIDIFTSIGKNNLSGYSTEVYEQYTSHTVDDLLELGLTFKESDISFYETDQECEIYIYASKDDLDFTINYMFYQSDITSTYVEISGSYEGYDSKSYQYLNEKDVNDICRYLGIDNAYSLFKDAHSELIPDSENPNQRYSLKYDNGYEITVHENSGEDYNRTLFSYSITK